jgi:DNA-binding response OmpR family regulator
MTGPMTNTTRRALVVEDDEGIAELWALALAEDGVAVEVRGSALGVAALLRRWRPDVVLLDLGLPSRSGASLLAELKADPATAAIPVVVVSAAPDALPLGYRGLAAAVLPKPVGLQALRATVHTTLTDAAQSAPPREGQEGAPPPPRERVPGSGSTGTAQDGGSGVPLALGGGGPRAPGSPGPDGGGRALV